MSTIGQALQTARRAQGFSQEHLAAEAGTTQVAISRYELDLRTPNDEVLASVATALHVTPEFLLGVDKVEGAWAIDAHLRRRATAKATIWRRQEARLNMFRHHLRVLLRNADVEGSLVMPSYDVVEISPEEAARLTRMQWRMPIGPVRSLYSWLEAAGCIVLEDDLGSDRVDGLSQWSNDHPLMLINRSAPTDRKRLTAAHELGHICLHTIDVGEDPEREANRFAAEFLMPAEVIRPQLRTLTLGKLLDLKRVWGVSAQALIMRAADLKLLTPEQKRRLFMQISSRGWRKQEPGSAELVEEVPQLARSIGASLMAQGMTRGELAQATGFQPDADDLRFLIADAGLRAV